MDSEIAYNYETLGDYNHLNPCRAGLLDVTQGQSVLDYPRSSLAGGYTLMPHQRAQWLVAVHGLAAIGRKRKERSYDASPERKAHGEQKALELINEGLRAAGLIKQELAGHRCTNPRKVLLAGLL